MGNENHEKFAEMIWAGPSLLGLEEFAGFAFEIRLEDPDIVRYTDLLNECFDNSDRELKQKLMVSLDGLCRKLLAPEKQKEMSGILSGIEQNYSKKRPDISLIAKLSRLSLDDDMTKYNLPLAIAAITRDVNAVYHGALDDRLEQVKDLITAGNTQDALAILSGFGSASKTVWDVHENLAHIYRKSGDKEKTSAEIQEALRIAGIYWKQSAPAIRYEIVEQLEKTADEYLVRPEKEILARFADYVYGMLYEVGAAELDDVISNLDATAVLPAFITKTVLTDALSKDDRFRIKDGLVYLSAIDNIDLLLSERRQKKIEFVLFRYSLSEIKLIHEGRMKDLFGRDEMAIDNELRVFTDGKWNLVSVRRRMRNDVTGKPDSMNSIVAGVSDVNVKNRIVKLMSVIWDYNPRWELGGMMPAEYARDAHPHGKDCSCGHEH